MDTTEAIQDTAVEAPATDVVAPPVDDLDSLLSEFDNTVGRQQPDAATGSAAEPVGQEQQPAAPDQSADPFAGLFGDPADKQRIDQLTGEVDALRTAEFQRQELAAFNQAADELQKQMPSWVPPDYAKTKMEALALNPEIALAWDLRNTDKAAANQELLKVQWALMQQQQNPAADPKQIEELKQYGYRLQVAVRSHSILRKATLSILNEAKALPKPYDDDAQALKEDIAFAMKGASAPILPDPPVQWGRLTNAEFRKLTREKFGYEPL